MIVLAKTLLWLLARLPAGGPYLIARYSAGLWMRLSPGKRRVTEVNLKACFPDLSDAEYHRLIKESFVHYVCSVLETGRNWYWPIGRLRSLCTEVTGDDLLHQSVESERGVLVLAPHFGAWEYLGLYMQNVLDLAILYKPASHPGFEKALLESRKRGGGKILAANAAGLRRLLAHLRAGKSAGVLPDQQPSEGQGIFVPFFGVPALTGVLAPRLAQKTNCIVLFLVTERLPNGHYHIHILPADDEVYSDDSATATAAISRGVEKCIATDPPQYLWSYKRFRSRPEGDPPMYS